MCGTLRLLPCPIKSPPLRYGELTLRLPSAHPLFRQSLESAFILPPSVTFPRTDGSAVQTPGTHLLVGGESGLLKIWNIDAKTLVYEEPTKKADFGIEYLVYFELFIGIKLDWI